MSNAARKARKRAGIKFEKPAKVGTPLESRKWFAGLVWGSPGTSYDGRLRPRSELKRYRAMDAHGYTRQKQKNIMRKGRKP